MVEEGLGIPVFTNLHTPWHFEDKLAEQYSLRAADIPQPRTQVFWRRDQAEAFCESADYPFGLELPSGIKLATFDSSTAWKTHSRS
ncbi:hypothetical protein [Salinisphaera dokdonensis]|uniref:hypothetical protein n=1 Tax=Salinisphaera dokdonensis TaxID=454598 RepID=UPI0033406F98